MNKPISEKDLDRREQILQTACICICKFGLQKTNAQLIANEMGISQTTIFYYFPKQQMLFNALFDHITTTGRALVAKLAEAHKREPTYAERLWFYLKAQLHWAEKIPEHTGVLMFSMVESAHNQELHGKISAALKNGEETIFSIIAGGIVEKKLPSIKNPKETALLLHKSLMGCMMDLYVRQKEKTAADYEKLLQMQVQMLLDIDPKVFAT